jgi:GNAT superfamily N-acetyltransferase
MNIIGEIKWFFGDDYAHLKFSESKTSFSIDIVMVPSAHRGAGIGTMLIRHVLYLADSMGKDVYVSARPFAQFSEEKLGRLITYYQRLGFEVTDRGLTTAYMRRKHSIRSKDLPVKA